MSRPIIVGIAGGSAAGKSTFARALAEQLAGLEVSIVGMDAYFVQDKPRHQGPFADREWPDFNQPASFHLDRLARDLDSAEGQVVIVEGLLVLHDEEIRRRCDLKLFVDAPADERICRRLKRNMDKMNLSFDEIAGYYLDSVRFRHQQFVEPSRWHADLIINGSLLSDPAVNAVADHIRARVGESV